MSLKLIIDNTKADKKDKTELIKNTLKVQKNFKKNNKTKKLSQTEMLELGKQFFEVAVKNNRNKECLTAEQYFLTAKNGADHFKPDLILLNLYYFMGAYEAAGDIYIDLTRQCDVIIPTPEFSAMIDGIKNMVHSNDYLEISNKNIKRFPRHWAVRAALGNAYLFQDNLKEALKHYMKAVKTIESKYSEQEKMQNKHMITPIFRLGEILYYQGIESNNDDEIYWRMVEKKLSQAEQLGLNNSDLFYYLGCIQLRKGISDKSIQYFKKSLGISLDNFDSALELFRIYLKEGEYEKAEEYLDIMKYIDPSDKACKRAESALKRCTK